ncbi:MAG: alkylhydroperoxidase AhpD family core domain protein [Ignavibacteriales bacterium CG07_land_8_20_14_0_80_59_12]|jgi:4-carboxymuconolactone decarboxylase|nr:MAG: alkylhydroperoxidase AhpD family core domain protein [Ignavibacteriales bacterium CG07_land_8_20_14_0_80_59_12]
MGATSGLNPQQRELIAIGASIGGNCLPCLRYHFAEAVNAGCTIEEIEEAINVAQVVKQRPINDINKLAADLLARERQITYSAHPSQENA